MVDKTGHNYLPGDILKVFSNRRYTNRKKVLSQLPTRRHIHFKGRPIMKALDTEHPPERPDGTDLKINVMKRAAGKERKLMTVKEMGDLLGLKKTERYYLLHKNCFTTRTIAGQTWIDRESFEEWYANQIRYHKITGEKPGQELSRHSYSIKDIGEMLGISEARAYELVQEKNLETILVDDWKRVPKEAFDRWYVGQHHYRTAEDRLRDRQVEKATISIPEMAALLGISKDRVYYILRDPRYADMLETIRIASRRRVTKGSFLYFLTQQNDFSLVTASAQVTAQDTTQNMDSVCADLADTLQWKDYISVAEAASRAGISRQAISKFADRGAFRRRRMCGVVRIRREDFEIWLLARKRNQTDGDVVSTDNR